MLQNAHRPARRRAARGKQRIERRGKGTDVVRAGIRDIAHFINSDRAEARERNIRGNVPELGSQNLLQVLLNCRQTLSADQNRAHFRQADPAFAIHDAVQALRHAAPQIDGQPVARSHDVIRARPEDPWESAENPAFHFQKLPRQIASEWRGARPPAHTCHREMECLRKDLNLRTISGRRWRCRW